MKSNLVQRQIRDRNGRWVTRWVRPDSREQTGASQIPPAARPAHAPSPRHVRWQEACLAIFEQPLEPRTVASRNLSILVDHEPALLAEIEAQCGGSPAMRAVWQLELDRLRAIIGGHRQQNKIAAAQYRPLVREYPRVAALLEAAGLPEEAASRGTVSTLYERASVIVGGEESPSDALYLLCIARWAPERGEYADPLTVGQCERLKAQAASLDGRAEELAQIVPELLRRGTTAPDVVGALLGAESAALRDGAL